MPAAFIGHGSPMNAIENNKYTVAWNKFGSHVTEFFGVPKSILCVSAHWYIGATAVTAMESPRQIYDFGGFPPRLSQFSYPAKGSTELAQRVVDLIAPHPVTSDHSSWGIDHGTWSILCHMFPEADVPVVQLSIDATKPADFHLEIGRALAPLRDEGVLVVGSGNIVHNLSLIRWDMPGLGDDWAQRFDSEARRVLTGSSPGQITKLLEHRDASRAVPTPEHFLPVIYVAGLAEAARSSLDVLIEGYELGSLSMTAFTLGN
ncbi:MAG: 4,5-DOPA dioxygenase extradiol [Ilumatobacteraceae bacterium]